MKPMIILPKGAMTQDNIDVLRANDICVVEADDPSAVKFVDPIPCVSSRTEIEHAAIKLSRRLLDKSRWKDGALVTFDFRSICQFYIEALVEGTPLDPAIPERQQAEEEEYDEAKFDELRRIAREDARAEAAEKKAAKAAKKA